MREAHRIAIDYQNARGMYLSEARREDLISFLVEKALVATIKFDPVKTSGVYGRNGGSHYDSYIADILTHRCTDWLRSRKEGNGDARYGHANVVTLVSDFDNDDDADVEQELERLVSDDRYARWREAAELVDLPLAVWAAVSLDRASAAIKRAAIESH